MPISSLPSPCGIGSLGQAARDFVDFLAAAGQRIVFLTAPLAVDYQQLSILYDKRLCG